MNMDKCLYDTIRDILEPVAGLNFLLHILAQLDPQIVECDILNSRAHITLKLRFLYVVKTSNESH